MSCSSDLVEGGVAVGAAVCEVAAVLAVLPLSVRLLFSQLALLVFVV